MLIDKWRPSSCSWSRVTLLLKRIIDLSSVCRRGPGLTTAVNDADG